MPLPWRITKRDMGFMQANYLIKFILLITKKGNSNLRKPTSALRKNTIIG
ncbi:MAG: hypothetical protein RI983_91 [Bacteroidota bacterium]|jgi:hypothetical protein